MIINSGIGIANAAATQSLINNFKVKTIYNYGSVGANNNLEIYDLIAPLKIFYHDVFTPWYKRGQTPKEKEFYKNSLSLENNNNNLASGSSFTINKDYWNKVKKDLNVDIIDMEAAAIAQICYKNKISLKVIKCVSDIIGQNNKTVKTINLQIKKAGKRAFLKTLEILTNQI